MLDEIELAFESILEARNPDKSVTSATERKSTSQIVAETSEKCARACESIGEKFRTGALAKMCAEACRSVR